jgi:flagellar biogenesis protein FliO
MTPPRVRTWLFAIIIWALAASACPAADDHAVNPAGPRLSVPSVSPSEPARTWAAPAGASSETAAESRLPAAATEDQASPAAAAAGAATTADSSPAPPAPRPAYRHRSSAPHRTAQPSAPAPAPMAAPAEAPPQTPQPATAAPAAPADADSASSGTTTLPWLHDAGKRSAGAGTGGSHPTGSGGMAAMAIGLGLKLGVVILLAYLCALAVRKVAQRRGALKIGGGGVLRVVESAALAPNRGLHIVSVGSRAFLVGSTPEQFSVLGEVSDVAEVAGLADADQPTAGGLAGRLRQWLNRQTPPAASRDPLVERLRRGAEFLRDRAARPDSRFDQTLQAAINEAQRR